MAGQIVLQDDMPDYIVTIGESSKESQMQQLVDLLHSFRDLFVFSHEEMLGIDLSVAMHSLNVRPECKPIK